MSKYYVESKVQTGRLTCNNCNRHILKSEMVVFLLDDCSNNPMQAVYCNKCKDNYTDRVTTDQQHPFDLDGG